jgi:hypothetical protein
MSRLAPETLNLLKSGMQPGYHQGIRNTHKLVVTTPFRRDCQWS